MSKHDQMIIVAFFFNGNDVFDRQGVFVKVDKK